MKKFQQEGWYFGTNRQHDICPGCQEIGKANHLAENFRVTDRNGPVPARSEIQAQTEQDCLQRRNRTHQALDRLFPSLPSQSDAMEASPAEPTADAEPAPSIEAILGSLAREMADLSAAHQLNLDQTSQIIAQNERVIEINQRLTKQNENILAKLDQTITAFSRLAENVGRQNTSMSENFSGATRLLREITERPPAAEPRWPQPDYGAAGLTFGYTLSLQPPVSPPPEPIPALIEPLEPKKPRRRLPERIEQKLGTAKRGRVVVQQNLKERAKRRRAGLSAGR